MAYTEPPSPLENPAGEPRGPGNFLNEMPARAQNTREAVDRGEIPDPIEEQDQGENPDPTAARVPGDPWAHRHAGMRCKTCMFFVAKLTVQAPHHETVNTLGRCRRHAPTMGGYPAVFVTDWCGDHKLDENK